MADIDLSKFVKSLSIQEWVAQDTYLLKKSATSASIAASGTDLGSTAHAGDNFALDFTETLSITGYNQPVTITLPPEAANARDMTPQQ